MQNFSSSECDKLIPQGNVISQRNYVRVTLLDIVLDEAINQFPPEENPQVLSVGKVFTLALPISLIDLVLGKQATNPKIVSLGDRSQVLIGLDGSILPGYRNLPNNSAETVWIAEEALKGQRRIEIGKHTIDLNQTIVDQLRHGNAARIITKDTNEPIILRIQKPSLPNRLPGNPSQNRLFSQVPTGVFTADETGFQIFMDTMVGAAFGFSIQDIIDGFLADERAGQWHDPSLKKWKYWIPGLDDDTFSFYLDELKAYPQWPRNAPLPLLPKYPIAIVNVFSQTQELRGYTRGRLVESITLGPEETVETEVFTWDRSITERQDEFSTEYETSAERGQNTSTNAQITNDMENNVGANVGGNLGIGLPIESVKVDGGLEGDVSTELRTQNQSTVELLTNATVKASERFKSKHQIKTLTRRETGSERRVTRAFKNPNIGRTLDLHHFEVLGQYRVVTKLEEQQRLALLVENPGLGSMDRDWIRAHHHFLDDVLLHDVYRDGVEAAQILAAQEWIDELAAAEKKAQEEERQRLADSPTASGNQPGDGGLPRKGIFDKARKMADIFDKFLNYNLEQALDTIAQLHSPNINVSTSKVKKADRIISRLAWWTQFNIAYPMMEELATQYIAEIDAARNAEDPQQQQELVISAVGSIVNNLDDDWLMALKQFAVSYVLFALIGNVTGLSLNPLVNAYLTKLFYHPDDLGLTKLLTKIRADYKQHEAKQSVEVLAPPVAPADTLTPADQVPPPPRAYSQKELAEAHASYGRLKAHLEAHEQYYRNEYYKREDPALRMLRLEKLGVAPYVENSILGFSGNGALYPLKLAALPAETTRILDDLMRSLGNKVDEIAHEAAMTLPTGGITSEMIMGQCDALEPHLVELRALDLRTAAAQTALLEIAAQERQLQLNQLPSPPTADSNLIDSP